MNEPLSERSCRNVYYLYMKTAKPSLWTYLLCCMMLFSHLLLQYKPMRAWLTNGIESIILPPFVFFLDYWFFFLFSFYNLLKLCTMQKKKWCAHIVEVGDADGMAKWSWPLSDTDCTSIYLTIDGRCRTAPLTQTIDNGLLSFKRKDRNANKYVK